MVGCLIKKVLPLGPKQTRGFGIAASVPLTAKEYIYELAGLISVDGNAEHTRLPEYEATDKTVRLLIGPLRMVNHDCNPNAEVCYVFSHGSILYVSHFLVPSRRRIQVSAQSPNLA